MTTAFATPLTVADIEAAYESDEWLGFGYLGERERCHRGDVVHLADQLVLAIANELGWTRPSFEAWLNSKSGRWAGDVLFGNPIDATTDGQLRRLMTLEGLE